MEYAEHTALNILKQIRRAGFEAFFAGGSVRDKLLGRTAGDYDIATSARPEQIEALFPKTVAVGKAFGVIIVVQDGFETEVATFRTDGGYQDGRRPDTVRFCGAEEDAVRRDFTINGMFYDPLEDRVIDYVGGQEDLQKKIIRAIGDPDKRFDEDRLRMLRAVRFVHTLGFTLEPATRTAIRRQASGLKKISTERIEHEFSRILTESRMPGDALRELVDLGLMEHIIPEVLPMIGQEQPPQFHPEGDVFEHTVLMLNLMKARGADAPVCDPSRGADALVCDPSRGADALVCDQSADEGVRPTPTPTSTPTPNLSPFRPLDGEIHRTHRRLPHWQQNNRIYFITFRTKDSLPQSGNLSERPEDDRDSSLDRGYGACVLKNRLCRAPLEEALHHGNGIQYDLRAYVIMPNHVHLLAAPYEGAGPSDLIRAWKSISARKINKILNTNGSFWMDESFDHMVRTASDLEKFIRYIQDNPKKARIKEDEFALFVAQTPSSAILPVAQTPPSAINRRTRVSAPPKNPPNFGKLLAYTALLHDVGKPPTAVRADDRWRFHGHDRTGAKMAEDILRRLKLPSREIKQIVTAIDGHMRFKDVQKMNRSTLRKLMGSETFHLEMELHRLDCEGSHRLLDNHTFLIKQSEEMKNEPVLPERWITGKDLCGLGVKPGPSMGVLLQKAYDAQLEGLFQNREDLLAWLRTSSSSGSSKHN